ncbi:MAG: hypothetical protein KBF93_04420 [Leptospiraceae bacterium]|nr:hypothetical protein [Leptospiraceae bacterium]
MALSWNEIKERAVTFSKEWENTISEDAEAKPFFKRDSLELLSLIFSIYNSFLFHSREVIASYFFLFFYVKEKKKVSKKEKKTRSSGFFVQTLRNAPLIHFLIRG